jgi:hypothetical protein
MSKVAYRYHTRDAAIAKAFAQLQREKAANPTGGYYSRKP